MTQVVRHHRRPDEESGTTPSGVRLTRLAVSLGFIALVGILLSLSQAPMAQAMLLILALLVPIAGYTVVVNDRLGGYAPRSLALGIGVTLSLWSALDFLLIGGLHTAAPVAQAIILTVLLAPMVWWLSDGVALRSARSKLHVTAVVRALPPLLLVTMGVGAGALVLRHAQNVARPQASPNSAFPIFWGGMALVFVPIIVVTLYASVVSPTVRLVMVGVASYTWAFVRSPLRIFNYDEYGHLAEAREIVFSSRLFHPDTVVPIGPKYPGFETLVVGIARLTGLPIVATGQLCILLFHVTTVCAIAALTALVHPGTRLAPLLGGLLYAVSPQFVAFDSIFAYESFALPLFVLVLVLTCSAIAGTDHGFDYGRRCLWLAAFFTLVLLITHHLTPLLLGAGLLGAAITHGTAAIRHGRAGSGDAPALRRQASWLALGGAGVVGAVVIWAVLVDADLPGYLGAFPRSAVNAFRSLLGFGDSVNIDDATSFAEQQNSTRSLFQGTQLPVYERYVGIIAQLLLLVACGVVLWRARRRVTPWLATFALFAAAYFGTLPLALVSVASSGAHRTWAFSFIGVAVVAAGLLTGERRSGASGAESRTANRRLVLGGAVLVPLVLMGSFATSVNLYSRFPGPYVMGADGRDDTADVKSSAEWLLRTAGPDTRILALRRNAAVFSSIAASNLVDFPGWLIFYPTRQPPQGDVAALHDTGVQYLVVDSRLATAESIQSYFRPSEPDPSEVPLPRRSVTKFESSPWLTPVHRDGHITIYRVVGS